MRNVFMLCLLAGGLALTSFSKVNTPHLPAANTQACLLDDYPDAITGLISGSNNVQVHLYRNGTDAGQGGITFEVDILFNDSHLQTFTFYMSNGETYRDDIVYGPNPTAFAEVRDVRIISRD